MDKAKFGLLGFIIIMAVVIAGCPMEINTNIGTDISKIADKTKTVTETVTEIEEVPVPGPDKFVSYKLNRLRVINTTTRAVTSVLVDNAESLAASATIGTNEQKVFTIEPKTLPAILDEEAPEANYQVGIGPHGKNAEVKMPPDAAVLVSLDADGKEIITVIPEKSLVPPYIPKTPGKLSARIIVYNTSNDHEITGIQVGGAPAETLTPPIAKWTSPTTDPPKYHQKEIVLTTDPETHTITAVRSSGGNITTDPISMTDYGIYSIFIGNTAATVFDFDPPGPVKGLVLTPDHAAGSVTATWKAPDEIPPDFAGYTIQLDGGAPILISRGPSTAPNAPETWTSPAGLSLGLHTITVSARDTNGNYSAPAVEGAILLTQVSVNITLAQLPEPVMYSKATAKIDATDWEATIAWTSDITITGETSSLETITGVPRYRGANTYTAGITITARPGKVLGGPIKYNGIQIGSVTSSVSTTVSSAPFPVTFFVGQNWYVWPTKSDGTFSPQPSTTKNNGVVDPVLGPWSGTGGKNAPVSRLDIIAHRIATERESRGLTPAQESPVRIYAMGELLDGRDENGTSEPVMKIAGQYWSGHVLLQGGDGDTYSSSSSSNYAKVSGTSRDTIQVGAGKTLSLAGTVTVSTINPSNTRYAAISVEEDGIFRLNDASKDGTRIGKFEKEDGTPMEPYGGFPTTPGGTGRFPAVGDSNGYGIKVNYGAEAYLCGGSVKKCTEAGVYVEGGSWIDINSTTVEKNNFGIYFQAGTDGAHGDRFGSNHSPEEIYISNSKILNNDSTGIIVRTVNKDLKLVIGLGTVISDNRGSGLDLQGFSHTILRAVWITRNEGHGLSVGGGYDGMGIAHVTMNQGGETHPSIGAGGTPMIDANKSTGVYLSSYSNVDLETGTIEANRGEGPYPGGVYLTNGYNYPLSDVTFTMIGGNIINNRNETILSYSSTNNEKLPQQGAGGVGIYINGYVNTEYLAETVGKYKVRFKKSGGTISGNTSAVPAGNQMRVAYNYGNPDINIILNQSSMNPLDTRHEPTKKGEFGLWVRDLTWGSNTTVPQDIDFRYTSPYTVTPNPNDWGSDSDGSALPWTPTTPTGAQLTVPVWKP
jgi:hypothetical protein